MARVLVVGTVDLLAAPENGDRPIRVPRRWCEPMEHLVRRRESVHLSSYVESVAVMLVASSSVPQEWAEILSDRVAERLIERNESEEHPDIFARAERMVAGVNERLEREIGVQREVALQRIEEVDRRVNVDPNATEEAIQQQMRTVTGVDRTLPPHRYNHEYITHLRYQYPGPYGRIHFRPVGSRGTQLTPLRYGAEEEPRIVNPEPPLPDYGITEPEESGTQDPSPSATTNEFEI